MTLVIALVIAAGLGLIPASIAKRKGYSFGLWWFYGWMLFIVAIIHVALIEDKNKKPVAYVPVGGAYANVQNGAAVKSESCARLFTLPERLYQIGAPVCIVEGALLKNEQNGCVLSQLKLQSITDKTIRAVKASVSLMDAFGKPMNVSVEHQYLDLCVKRGHTFGEETTVILPDAHARAFRAAVTAVMFDDGTLWEASEAAWAPLPEPVMLDEVYPDAELRKQFKLEFGAQNQYAYAEFADLCRCPCGTLNRQEEAKCHTCGCDLTALRALDSAELRKRRDARLERERLAEEERQARKKKEAAEAAERAKKAKKIALIAAPIVCVVIAFLIVLNSVIIPNVKYNNAVTLMEAGQYEEAIEAFEAMDGYKDSAENIESCEAAVELAELNAKYEAALALMEAEDYEEAITAFELLDGHKDSEDKIDECETAILDAQYDAALAQMDGGEYEDAITAFEALAGYKDSGEKIRECETAILDGKYDNAVELLESGKYRQSLNAFDALGNYKDSKEKRAECKVGMIKTTEVGDYVYFGSYEQDNNTSNGEEDIEWLVLDVENDKALLISKYALDWEPYNTENAGVTWETSTLRKWLNDDFLNAAFSEDEQGRIPTVTVSAEENPTYNAHNDELYYYGTVPGSNTQDRVFLLSIQESKVYFESDDARRCQATAYAVAKHDGEYGLRNGAVWWWLRSPGVRQDMAALVIVTNKDVNVLDYQGASVVGYNAVRPAIWVEIGE